jgi:nicotinate dehydrogenase subunit A
MATELLINNERRSVDADPATPLLYVLRNELGLVGAKFGCGVAQCGSCTVLVDGAPARSCALQIGALSDASITTLEGIGEGTRLDALQSAFVAEQAAQCGYCTSGMIMTAKALLDRVPKPSEEQVREALNDNLCRCGAHNRIVRAVMRAAASGDNR